MTIHLHLEFDEKDQHPLVGDLFGVLARYHSGAESPASAEGTSFTSTWREPETKVVVSANTKSDPVAVAEEVAAKIEPKPKAKPGPKPKAKVVEPEPEPEPEDEEEVDPLSDGEPTRQDATNRVTELLGQNRAADVRKALGRFNVKRLAEVKDSDIPEFVRALADLPA